MAEKKGTRQQSNNDQSETGSRKPAATSVQDRREVLSKLRPGMTVRVHQKIKEGDKERTQIFEGIVLARHRHLEPNATFRVRKISEGIGVERIFPAWSPLIEKIDLVSQAQVRQAKLYYLRDFSKKLRETPIKT